jgi:Lysyl-tRNA synthetase (class II)
MYDDPNGFVAERLRKRDDLRAMGVDPYPAAAYSPTHTIPDVRRDADVMADKAAHVRVAGRIVGRREMGKVVFIDLLDDGAKLQVFLKRSRVSEETWRVLSLLDLGDFIGVEGKIFYTRMGELSVRADTLTVLGKASHTIPLPKQQGDRVFNAVIDKRTLYRHRHVDLICNPSSRDLH